MQVSCIYVTQIRRHTLEKGLISAILQKASIIEVFFYPLIKFLSILYSL